MRISIVNATTPVDNPILSESFHTNAHLYTHTHTHTYQTTYAVIRFGYVIFSSNLFRNSTKDDVLIRVWGTLYWWCGCTKAYRTISFYILEALPHQPLKVIARTPIHLATSKPHARKAYTKLRMSSCSFHELVQNCLVWNCCCRRLWLGAHTFLCCWAYISTYVCVCACVRSILLVKQQHRDTQT